MAAPNGGFEATAGIPWLLVRGRSAGDRLATVKLSMQGFPTSQRLLRHSDFQRVYSEGRRHFAAHMTVFYLLRHNPASPGWRVGFTVGKVLGGAVERNRMKRRLREAVRLSGFAPEIPADIVIHPKPSLQAAEFSRLQNEIEKAFEAIEKSLMREKLSKGR